MVSTTLCSRGLIECTVRSHIPTVSSLVNPPSRGIIRRCNMSTASTSSSSSTTSSNTGSKIETTLWRWGSNKKSGSAGILSYFSRGRSSSPDGVESDCPAVPSAVDIPSFSNTTHIAVGSDHSLFVDNGKIYTFGENSKGQLGRDVAEGKKTDPVPRSVEIESDSPVVHIAAGGYHSAALLEDGSVWTWGWGGSGLQGANGLGHGSRTSVLRPTKVPLEEDAFCTAVACGQQHTLLTTSAGRVYTCGKGEFGRLGNGSNSDALSFEPLEFFDALVEKKTIKKLSAGIHHSVALTDCGEVFVWGKNDRGQLGTSDAAVDMYSCEIYPRSLRSFILEGIQIADIDAGDDSCIAVTRNGVIYAWGRAVWLQPRALNLDPRFENAKIKGSVFKVGAGHNFQAAITEEGELFTWGKGHSGCLGVESTKDQIEPTPILSATLNNEAVIDVSCGSRRALAVTQRHQPPLISHPSV